MGLGLAAVVAGFGATTMLAGAGLVWASSGVARKEAPSFTDEADKEMASV